MLAHLLARSFRHVDVLDHLAVQETDDPLTVGGAHRVVRHHEDGDAELIAAASKEPHDRVARGGVEIARRLVGQDDTRRSEEHTSELQSLAYLVCRLLLEKKKKIRRMKDLHRRQMHS